VSNIVAVRKKNEEIRVCIDFRNLNKACLKDNYPLPSMDHILQTVTSSEMMATLDGFSSYNQVAVDMKDRHKTAFVTLGALTLHQDAFWPDKRWCNILASYGSCI
jgi:hypothetical protein